MQQDDFKQKKWDEINDQSKSVPNLPIDDDIDLALKSLNGDISSDQIYNKNPINSDMVNFNDYDMNKQEHLINNTQLKPDPREINHASIDVGDKHISYVGGVPIIHSLSTDQDMTNSQNIYNDHSSDHNIDSIHRDIDKEKRVKVFLIVFVFIILIFVIIIFSYFYFKNKANTELAYEASRDNSILTNKIESNNIINNNNIDNNPNHQEAIDLKETDMNSTNINNNIKESLKRIWPNIDNEVLDNVVDFVVGEENDYVLLKFKSDYVFDIKDANFETLKPILKSVFNIDTMPLLYKETLYKGTNIKIYNADKSNIIVTVANNSLIITNTFANLNKALSISNK